MKITDRTSGFLKDLLEDLEMNFRNQIPIHAPISLDEFRRLQGQQEVVQFVRNLINNEEED